MTLDPNKRVPVTLMEKEVCHLVPLYIAIMLLYIIIYVLPGSLVYVLLLIVHKHSYLCASIPVGLITI